MKRIYRENEIAQLYQYMNEYVYDHTSLVSGFFHPTIHSGHIAMFRAAEELGHFLIVIVNGEKSTKKKYGKQLVSIEERLLLVAEMRMVSAVLEWDFDDVAEAIKILEPTFFCNGGDRKIADGSFNKKELDACKEANTMMRDGVGGFEKVNSNSKIIEDIKQTKVSEWMMANRCFNLG